MEVAWNTRNDTGIRSIDEQHRELFRILKQLSLVVRDGAAHSVIEALLADLVTRCEHHFTTEEHYMTRYNYPDLAQHLAEHASMLMSLNELLKTFQENQQAMALMVPTFMEGWLKHHISDGDFGFVTFLKAHNLA